MIQLNPAYQNASLVSESNDDEEVQSTDSESSEYIVVDVEEPINSTDGTKTAAQRLASILSKKQSILRRWEAESTRKSPPKRMYKYYISDILIVKQKVLNLIRSSISI